MSSFHNTKEIENPRLDHKLWP